MQRLNRWILRGRAVKRVKTARIGEEPECRLCRARVAKKIGEGGRFESEGGEESRARDGVVRVRGAVASEGRVWRTEAMIGKAVNSPETARGGEE
jgi:hypothetical protein